MLFNKKNIPNILGLRVACLHSCGIQTNTNISLISKIMKIMNEQKNLSGIKTKNNISLISLDKIFNKYIIWRKDLDSRFYETLNNEWSLNKSYSCHTDKDLIIENLLLNVIKFFGRENYEDFIPLYNSLINIEVLILYCNYLENLENLGLTDDWIPYENILTYDKFYQKLKQEFITEITWNTEKEKDKDFSISFIETLSQDEIFLLKNSSTEKNINKSNDNKDILALLGHRRSYHSYTKFSKSLNNNVLETNITIVGIYVTSTIYYFKKIVNQIKITLL
jgi:hypothetical protein